MQVIEMNQGKKIGYKLTGSTLRLGEDYEIDIAERQKDIEVKIDVFVSDDNKLMEEKGKQYVANIIIPACRYKTVEREEEINGEIAVIQAKEPEGLNIDTVILQLWAIPEENKNIEGGI